MEALANVSENIERSKVGQKANMSILEKDRLRECDVGMSPVLGL